MAELKNTFSWSFSAGSDFDDCRRRRYWNKYGMWGGWSRSASEDSQLAYRLNKMNNRYSLQGQAAEEAVMWVLAEKQQGRDRTTEEAYDTIAKPYLNTRWKESINRDWEKHQNPKKYFNLREHYYESDGTNAEWIQQVTVTIKACLNNFIEETLPRVQHVTKDMEIEIATVTKGGDPEHFIYEGVKIYAIPDYVYVEDGKWHIIDWKSGRAKDDHRYQLATYGLWANIKYGIAPEDIIIYLEYLADGSTAIEPFSEELLETIRERMSESIGEMREYLEAGDLEKNKPIPKDEWELAPSSNVCRFCNFWELCKPEMEELGL